MSVVDASHGRPTVRAPAPPPPPVSAEAERTIPRGVRRGDGDPTPAVEEAVWLDHVEYARTGDPRVLERLVREYEAYARSLARRLWRADDLRDDLEQVALEALIGAIRRFDPERSVPFAAFATPTILGAVRRHYRDHGWTLRVPRRIHDFAVAERRALDELTVSLGRVPTPAELAADMGITIDALLDAQDAVHARRTVSIDGGREEPDGDGLQVGGLDPRFDAVDQRQSAAAAIAELDATSRNLLRSYFLEERSQSDIAAELGVSQMQVSRLLASALRRLRSRVAPVDEDSPSAWAG